RDHAVEPRALAEDDLRRAGKLDRPLLGPVLDLDLLQQAARRRQLHPRGGAPEVARYAMSAAKDQTCRAREGHRAIKARHATLEPQHAVGFRRQLAVGRVEIELDLEAVIAGAAHRDAVAIMVGPDQEAAFALERTDQRAEVAIEPQGIEDERGRAP